MKLFGRAGYGATSVDSIAAAAGIGRATFFRYFPSKAAIVWTAFEREIERLEKALASTEAGLSAPQSVRAAIVASMVVDETRDPLWRARYNLLEDTPELQRGLHDHWVAWNRIVSAYVADRLGPAAGPVVPAAVGGAFHAAYVAAYRLLAPLPHEPGEFKSAIDELLEPVARSLEHLVVGTYAVQRRA